MDKQDQYLRKIQDHFVHIRAVFKKPGGEIMGPMDKKYSGIERRMQRRLEEVKKGKLYTPQNQHLIAEFVNTCRAKKISPARTCFYLDKFKQFSTILNKDFKKWEKKDVEFVMTKIGERNYTQWTMEGVKVALKVFFRWLYDLESSDPAPKLVRWLSKEHPPSKIRKEDLLTRKDIRDMLNATNKPMHKALIAVLNSGPRPGEVTRIRMKDIKEFNGLVKIYVYGKMGKKMGERPLYLTEYLDEFKSWVRRHPNRDEPNAFLFYCSLGPLQYFGMAKIISRLAIRAGIMRYKRDRNGMRIKDSSGKFEIEGKKVWLYLFRHTAGTRYYGNYEGSYARRLMGHVAGSKMEAVYCHLSEEDIEARLLGRSMTEAIEPDIPSIEKKSEELLAMGKLFKKIAHEHPEIINIEKLKQRFGD